MNRKEIISNGLLWFGASVSIAEIFTGGFLAPLGFKQGLLAILVGHLIGAILMYFAGMIGGISKLPSIKSSRISFGKIGSYGFSLLNILQLIGWTAVMIIGGARALNGITTSLFNYDNVYLFSAVISAFIIIWVLIGLKNLDKLNVFVVSGLFILSIILGIVVFKDGSVTKSLGTGEMSMGLGIELSVAMCLSWLPLIGDYTSLSKNPKAATISSVIAYFFGSSLMYIIGLGSALYANTTDISAILLAAGLGTTALLIVLLSTVTTTFLDVYSAGISFENINNRFNSKVIMIIATVIGLILAVFINIEQYESFLMFIGSVFAPMISILIADFFLLKRREIVEKADYTNIIIWGFGFALYNGFVNINTYIGSSVPVILLIIVITVIVRRLQTILLEKRGYKYGKNN